MKLVGTPGKSNHPHSAEDPDWWRQAVVYQVYPRSFADANGDGIGDLRGIITRIPYLKELGVDAVWLSPFYPSALADGGYDVDDYRAVDPRLGTLHDFDELTAALHAANLRVIVDIVPNHTSDRHRWFLEARSSAPGSAERARYIFREGRGAHGEQPPNSWGSIFGGSAWERIVEADGTPGQWYLHLFGREQPDLNWDNPDVQADFLHTIRFWADRGVDGFRVDVAHGLAKNLDPAFDAIREILGSEHAFEDGQHPLFDRDEVHDIYAQWRAVFNEYDPPRFAVAEAWVPPHRRARYASAGSLGQAFSFDLLPIGFNAQRYRQTIDSCLASAEEAGATSTWVLSNHDVVRHSTRFGLSVEPEDAKGWLRSGGLASAVDIPAGLRRAKTATLLMLGLPGSAYLYQGEELGLQEVGDLADDAREDPAFRRSGGRDIGRDGCRVPLPWTTHGTSFGFGEGHAFLPQPPWFAEYAVDVQAVDDRSTLTFYRKALRLRRRLQGEETLRWHNEADPDVLHFERPGGWHVIANFGHSDTPLPAGEVLVSSDDLTKDGKLPAESAAWVRT